MDGSVAVRSRRGFTLGEVLVTVAIVAVLAAVVIPAIGGQITKGDLGRVEQDLMTLRGSMEAFLGDVRKYPNSIGQLTNAPGVTEVALSPATVYTAAQIARWRGPYFSKDSVSGLATGFSFTINPTFGLMTAGLTDVFTPASPGASDPTYAVIAIPGVPQATALTIDVAMDDGNLTTGSIRWRAASPGPKDTLKFLALTVNK